MFKDNKGGKDEKLFTLIDIIVVNFGGTRQHNHAKKGSQK
jgi:hypothetical protein